MDLQKGHIHHTAEKINMHGSSISTKLQEQIAKYWLRGKGEGRWIPIWEYYLNDGWDLNMLQHA